MQKILAESYLLHTLPFKETSLIVRMFGKHQGRFSVVAKGVKRKQSQAIRAILQPFSLLKVEYTGKSELKTLCHIELSDEQTVLSSRSLACGYYLNELLIRSTEEWQDFPRLFTIYRKSIQLLQRSQNMTAEVSSGNGQEKELRKNQQENHTFAEILRTFEVTLLAELGVVPDWINDIFGDKIKSSSRYHYVNEQGFSEVEINADYQNTFLGESLIALGTAKYKDDLLNDCQRVTQMLLRKIIGDKPLESRKLWI